MSHMPCLNAAGDYNVYYMGVDPGGGGGGYIPSPQYFRWGDGVYYHPPPQYFTVECHIILTNI